MICARVTLVTGFPSHGAEHFVRHLLDQTRDHVWALVSGPDLPRAERRMVELAGVSAGRTRLLAGELGAIDMGLSGAEYRELAKSVRCIQHFARASDGARDDECEAINIGGMREVLELCRAASELESLVVHSSVGVSGDRVGRVAESELAVGQRFSGPAVATLARAELMAHRCMSSLPIVVVRAGQVVTPLLEEQIDALSGIHQLIVLSLSSPRDLSASLASFGDAPLNVVPVDFLVRASDFLGRNPLARGHTLHLTDRQPISVRRAFELCTKIRAQWSAADAPLPPPSSGLWRGSLRDSVQSILRRPRAHFDMMFRNVHYGTEVADRLLDGAGLCCPRLETYLEHLVKQVAHAILHPRSVSAAS